MLDILAIRTDEDYKKRFAGTPLMRSKRMGLLRNACVVAGNQKFKEAGPALEEIMRSEADSVLGDHARWALEAISSS